MICPIISCVPFPVFHYCRRHHFLAPKCMTASCSLIQQAAMFKRQSSRSFLHLNTREVSQVGKPTPNDHDTAWQQTNYQVRSELRLHREHEGLCKIHVPKCPIQKSVKELSKPTLATVRTCPGNDLWLLEYPSGETNRRFPRTWQTRKLALKMQLVSAKCLWSKAVVPWWTRKIAGSYGYPTQYLQ